MKRKHNYWRLARRILAAIMLTLLVAAILRPRLLSTIFLTQFGSDVLSLCANFTIGALAAVIGILLMTLIIGRAYCSILCPLGILQDIVGHFHLGKYRNTPFKRKIRGPIFCLVLFSAILGFLLPLTLLMPSANFVFICNHALRGLAQLLNNGIHVLQEPITLEPMPVIQFTAWFLLILLIFLVQWQGRIFCNTLCPVGAALSLVAKKSYVHIDIDAGKCVHCGACEHACKAGCIDSKLASVRYDECVLCMNCLDKCPKNALSLKHHNSAPQFQAERRDFLLNGTASIAGAIIGGAVKISVATPQDVPPIMPPGAGNRDRFAARCVGCGLCIGACSGKVLKASFLEYGLLGFQQPVLDPYRGACDFGCHNCSKVCPCGALTPLSKEEKRTTRIGIAHWEPYLCVAFVDEEDCGACSEHCPVGALTMENIPGHETKVPQVNTDLCIGCGACQNICPIRPTAAIVVHGVPTQCRVAPPKAEATNVNLQQEEDFPF